MKSGSLTQHFFGDIISDFIFLLVISIQINQNTAQYDTNHLFKPTPFKRFDVKFCMVTPINNLHVPNQVNNPLDRQNLPFTLRCLSNKGPLNIFEILTARNPFFVQLLIAFAQPFPHAYDACTPILNKCLGTTYMLSSTIGNSYAGIFNLNDIDIEVTSEILSMKKGYLLIDGIRLVPKMKFLVNKKSIKYITTEKNETFDGVEVSSLQKFGVIVCTLNASERGESTGNALIEFIPPSRFFSNEYVTTVQNGASSILKIISLSEYHPVKITLTILGEKTSRLHRTLYGHDKTWTYLQKNSVHVSSNESVMVVQYPFGSLDNQITSMIVIPPVRRWIRTAFLYPLVTETSPPTSYHTATIVIQTSLIEGLSISKLVNKTDLTQSMSFKKLQGSAYSVTEIEMEEQEKYFLYHKMSSQFQVIQHGGIEGFGNTYTFSASSGDMDCNDIIDQASRLKREDNKTATEGPGEADASGPTDAGGNETEAIPDDPSDPKVSEDEHEGEKETFTQTTAFIVIMVVIIVLIAVDTIAISVACWWKKSIKTEQATPEGENKADPEDKINPKEETEQEIPDDISDGGTSVDTVGET